MNLQYYFNFVTIVEEGSLTAAAKKLRIAQPALSNQVKAMEQKYGTRLFFRGSRRLELTDAGSILYQKAKRICEIELAAKNEIASGFSGQRGTLRLGVTSSLATDRLYNVLSTFLKKYPETNVKILEDSPAELLRLLQKGQVEAVMVQVPYEINENFEVLYRAEDELVAMYAPDAPFFKDCPEEEIPFEKLDNVPLSIVEKSRSTIASVFREKNMKLNIKCLSTRLQMTMRWARTGLAVALASKNSMNELGFGDMAYKRISGHPLAAPRFTLVAQKRKYRTQVIDNFLYMLSAAYKLGIETKLAGPIFDDDDEEVED